MQPENEVYFKSGGPSALAPEAARAAANNLGRPKLRSQLVRLETGCSQVGVELAGLGGLGFTRRALQDGFCGIQTKRPAVASFLRIILVTKIGSEDFHSSSRLIFRWHGSCRRYPRSGSPMRRPRSSWAALARHSPAAGSATARPVDRATWSGMFFTTLGLPASAAGICRKPCRK